MSTNLENKLIVNYWTNKLKNCLVVNDNFFVVSKSNKLFIRNESLSYFNKLTANNEVVEFTVLFTVYSILLQRYFESTQFITSFKSSEENALLFKALDVENKNLKESLTSMKLEIQEVFKYSSINKKDLHFNSFNRYSPFCFAYKKLTNQVSNFPFSLIIHKEDEGINISICYDTNFTKAHIVDSFLHSLELWLMNLKELIGKENQVNTFPLLSKQREQNILYSFNDTLVDYPKDKTAVDLFEEQVEKTPNVTALIFEQKKFTYKELNEVSNQLASYIRLNYSIKPDDLIGVKLPRNEYLLITILAILKSGGAYVPIDISYPKERIDYLESNSNCKVIIDEKEIISFLKLKDTFTKENLLKVNVPNNLIYVMYTSGTTGNSKGVMIEHRNVVRLVKPCTFFSLSEENVLLSTGSTSFDATTIEYFGTLLNGTTLVITSKENLLETKRFKSLINKLNVNSLWMTASWFSQVVDQDIDVFKSITQLIVGGDVVSPIHTSKIFEAYPEIKLVNGYGPTENTTFSTTFEIKNEAYVSIPIGKPIPNSFAYILDEYLNPLPIGVAGKLYVSGAGVGRGYLNNIQLTEERFIKNPFVKGERMYDTGDLVKWLPDGNIEFLGRKDDQVKIRGYRIELGEIEQAIAQFSKDIQRVVLDVKSTKKELVAYYVATSDIKKSELRDFLKNRLPSYMIPSYYMQLETIKLTSNGKTDRRSLPEITSEALIQNEYIAPSNENEKQLVSIWKEVLGIEQIGVTDNFFELGGHSLQIGQILNRVYKQLNKSITFKSFFETPVIKDLSLKLSTNNYTAIPKAVSQTYYPLTTSQHRIWVLSQLEGGNIAYNISGAVKLSGNLDIVRLEQAFTYLINRHEILRTNFKVNEAGEVCQYISEVDNSGVCFLKKDVSKQTEESYYNEIKKEQSFSFDLEEGSLIKGVLFKSKESEYIFSLTMHHIIGDGWSVELLISEVISNYNNLINGCLDVTPNLDIQYKDYAVWLQSEVANESYKESEEYWISQFKGELPVLNLPSFKVRPKVQTYKGRSITHLYSKSFLERLKTFSKGYDATLFMTLMSGINVLLHRYTNQTDIIIGTPIAGREHPDLEGQIGLYLNTLAIRTQLEGESCFSEILASEKEILLSAYEHQKYPFDELVNKLNLQRDASRSVLFDVLVVLQNQSQLQNLKTDRSFEGLQTENYEVERSSSQLDISFNFVEREGLELSIEYNTDIYDESLINRMFAHFENLMNKVIDAPDQSIANVKYITKQEQDKLQGSFNSTAIAYQEEKTIVRLFEDQVLRTPHNIAVVFNETKLTYQELNEKSNQLANYLRDSYAIKPDDLIGIKLDRSEKLVITILSVLKSGAAFVPIDVNYPEERVNYLQKDSNCKLVITNTTLEQFESKRNQYSVNNLSEGASLTDLIYVMYTSGTTGNPKGVMVEHRNVTNLIHWFIERFEISEQTVALQLTDVSFDPSIEDIFSTLTVGGIYHCISKELLLDIQQLRNYIVDNDITILNYLPTFLDEVLSDIPKIHSIKTIISGGEALPEQVKKSILEKGYTLYNNYGPTEITVDALSCKVTNESVVLGTPIANAQTYILSDNLQLEPVGVVGELVISGAGVARGYLNKPDLTKEKFIENPFLKGEKMYKSGDLACWLPNGDVKYLGRKDSQVKIRGNRIELQEIENTIVQYANSIQQAILYVKETKQEKELIAYYVASSNIDEADLRNYIQSKLPFYMVPSYYMVLDIVPLTPNGKVDKKALPEITSSGYIQREYIAPSNEVEEQLVNIWKEVLTVDKIGVTDNFFELGGHSLKITKLRNLVNRTFEVSIKFNDFFVKNTIKDQCKLIKESAKNTANQVIPVLSKQESYTLSSSQQRIWMLSQFEGGNVAYNMPGVFLLEGTVDVNAMEKAFHALINRHEALRTRFVEDIETGEIRQFIDSLEESNFKLAFEETKCLHLSENDLNKYIEEEKHYQFNLSKESLIKAKLVKVDDTKTILVFVIHHIVSDGWSLEIITNELFAYYNAYSKNQEISLAPLIIQYKDYAAWEQNLISSEKMNESKAYWENQFKDEIPVLDLPTDKKRPLHKSYAGKLITQTLPADTLKTFRALCQKNNSTLFMGLFSVVNYVLYKYSNQKDIIIGTPIAGREHSSLQNQVGVYINTLALRTQFKAEDSFERLLSKVREVTLLAYEHQAYPFDKLVSDLPLQRDLGRNPLFDVMITLQNTGNVVKENNNITDVSITEYKSSNEMKSKLDLEFIFEEKEGELEIVLLYSSDVYEEELMNDIQTHLKATINTVINVPGESLYKLPFLTSKEKVQLIEEYNNTFEAYNKEETFLDHFKKQAENIPNAIAVRDEIKSYTYKELDTLSTKVAAYFNVNFKEDKSPIGVMLDRSTTTILLLLGILKSGRAYIPLDPTFPEDRLKYIIEHSNLNVLVSSEELLKITNNKIINITVEELLEQSKEIKGDLNTVVKGSDTAYIIYTSGSTGNPKGVEIGHSSLLNFLLSIKKEPGVKHTDVLFAVTTYSFDISILEFFTPLISGAAVYIVSNETLSNPDEIIQLLDEVKPTIIQATPSFYQQLFNIGWKGSQQLKILCGGDLLSEALADRLLTSNLELWNMYGPTETTIWSTTKRIETPNQANIIGKPILNTNIYVLDEFLQLQPKGTIGDLFIGGEGLAKGYYLQDELTNQRFIESPLLKERIYETGDVVRWNADGELVFLGRNDHQVKIRGYRIELGDVETKMNEISTIEKTVVVAKKDASQNNVLIAYYTCKKEVNVNELRAQLKEVLPYYMMPSQFISLKEFPLTPNKKIDRKALTLLKDVNISSLVKYVAPTTEIEQKLVYIWKDLLTVSQIGIKDDFFDLGGHSLSVTKLVSAIQKEFSIKIPINKIFEYPVLEEQSNLIENIQIINQNNIEENEELELESFSI